MIRRVWSGQEILHILIALAFAGMDIATLRAVALAFGLSSGLEQQDVGDNGG